MGRTWLSQGIVLACALGAPGGARAGEASPPIELRATEDLLSDVAGGVDRGTGELGRVDLTLDQSGEVLGIDGAEAHFDLMLLHGARFSDRFSGDAQRLSNVEAPRAIRPFEAWFQLPLGRHVRAKAGLVDLNSEFDQQPIGEPFLNSSFGIAPDLSQSGLDGPSIFPVTAPGLVVAAQDGGNRSLSIGLFDALPGDPAHPHRFLPSAPGRDGALIIAEAGLPLAGAASLNVGAWRYTDRFDRLDGRGMGTSGGVYAFAQDRLAGREKGMALRAWVRLGAAASQVNPIGVYAGGGLTYGDDDRLVGLAVAHARLGAPALRAAYGDRRAETAIELTAYRKISALLALQPDVQYIVHPSWRSATPDALVIGLRVHLDWKPRKAE